MLMVNQKFILRHGNFSAATEQRETTGRDSAAVCRGRTARTAARTSEDQ
jgi:hypothetical protein